ncbi:hypothetical protein HF313_11400 [Massilia atriviolacea]|uniref:DUF4347 domain-containing protein n=1 Tax=Massilia atriviolacea TaxID=2495579 RepID=A0A430HIN3_9BURK|nr:hypothetical protein [Massilia atriviolacea]RSZ57349.1 hypothetical protein EJB06_19525 [Massilia atriviolacea]
MSAAAPAHLSNDIPIRVMTATHSVFVYAIDLKQAGARLIQELAIRQYYLSWTAAHVKAAEALKAKYVWLVGHGEKTSTAIVNASSKPVIEMLDIVTWCEANGATHIIDTCCAPLSRLGVVKKSKTTLKYYCKKDDDGITQILGNTTLENWWATEQFEQRH